MHAELRQAIHAKQQAKRSQNGTNSTSSPLNSAGGIANPSYTAGENPERNTPLSLAAVHLSTQYPRPDVVPGGDTDFYESISGDSVITVGRQYLDIISGSLFAESSDDMQTETSSGYMLPLTFSNANSGMDIL